MYFKSCNSEVEPFELKNKPMTQTQTNASKREHISCRSVSYTHLDVYKRQPENPDNLPLHTEGFQQDGITK